MTSGSGLSGKVLAGTVASVLFLYALAYADRSDVPYWFLTGYSRAELVRLSFLPADELEERIGLAEIPGGYTGERARQGRAAHALASYLGTRRWGPAVTLACGYLKEYLPAVFRRRPPDPEDLAANYAGVSHALRESERSRR